MNAALTYEQEWSLCLAVEVAARLHASPTHVLAVGRRNLATRRLAAGSRRETPWLDAWSALLDGPMDAIVAVLTAPTSDAADLRAVAPFAGVVPTSVRYALHRDFRRTHSRAAA